MARRVFLHVGTPKTGTTYLQSLVWANKRAIADQGLLLPLDRVRDHFNLSNVARGTTDDMPARGLTSWDRMLDQVGRWQGDALISHELFAFSRPERAEWAIDQLRSVGDEVHPIITARDLARQIPAEWQQSVKHGRTHGLREFYELVQSDDPGIVFGRAQNLPMQVRMWSQGLPADNVHLITVPAVGGDRDLLWTRFAGVIGIDPDSVDHSGTLPNESLGVVEVEMLRRVNQFSPQGESKPLRQLMVRQVLADGILAGRANAQRFAPPAELHPWVVEHGTAIVEELRGIPCDVVGDLDELLPAAEPASGPVPDDVDDSAVAAVAVETISAVLYRSHERETEQYTNQIARLTDQLERRTARVAELQRTPADVRTPVWKRAARRLRDLPTQATAAARRLLRRSS